MELMYGTIDKTDDSGKSIPKRIGPIIKQIVIPTEKWVAVYAMDNKRGEFYTEDLMGFAVIKNIENETITDSIIGIFTDGDLLMDSIGDADSPLQGYSRANAVFKGTAVDYFREASIEYFNHLRNTLKEKERK